MAGIAERVRQLNLPLDQVVVIGGGILDALNLRTANDVDLVFAPELFAQIVRRPDWQVTVKHGLDTPQGELVVMQGDAEAFLSWGSEGRPNFAQLYEHGMTVDGVRFAHPEVVIDWKQQRGSDKDQCDIALLQEYLAR
ncbi:MAG: hypothetical protein ACHQTE_02130 [Candidatus Saccharimonadales bacterium]